MFLVAGTTWERVMAEFGHLAAPLCVLLVHKEYAA
jgi:hypothetical protein